MIAYKVVEKGTRFGSNVTINKYSNLPFESKSSQKRTLKLRRKHKEWFPKYFKGTTVKMAPGSVGILAFRTHKAAGRFRDHNTGLEQHAMIIRVRIIGELLPKVRVIAACANFNHLLRIIHTHDMPAPLGTLFCRAVEVLE